MLVLPVLVRSPVFAPHATLLPPLTPLLPAPLLLTGDTLFLEAVRGEATVLREGWGLLGRDRACGTTAPPLRVFALLCVLLERPPVSRWLATVVVLVLAAPASVLLLVLLLVIAGLCFAGDGERARMRVGMRDGVPAH